MTFKKSKNNTIDYCIYLLFSEYQRVYGLRRNINVSRRLLNQTKMLGIIQSRLEKGSAVQKSVDENRYSRKGDRI